MRVVVFPEPLGPSRVRNSPEATLRETSSTASTAPNDLDTATSSSSAPCEAVMVMSADRARSPAARQTSALTRSAPEHPFPPIGGEGRVRGRATPCAFSCLRAIPSRQNLESDKRTHDQIVQIRAGEVRIDCVPQAQPPTREPECEMRTYFEHGHRFRRDSKHRIAQIDRHVIERLRMAVVRLPEKIRGTSVRLLPNRAGDVALGSSQNQSSKT